MKYGIGFFHTPYTLDEIVTKFCSDPLVNEPGTKFDYNNGEYMILGRILEEIYKLSYEQILNQQIDKKPCYPLLQERHPNYNS